MDASDDHMEEVELPAAALDTAVDGEQAVPAANEDADMRQPAAPADDTEMAAGDHASIEGITVTKHPPDDATGVTAYFLFANGHRERVKSALQQDLPESTRVTIGMVGKKIGELWKQCTDEVKQAYSEKAKAVRS